MTTPDFPEPSKRVWPILLAVLVLGLIAGIVAGLVAAGMFVFRSERQVQPGPLPPLSPVRPSSEATPNGKDSTSFGRKLGTEPIEESDEE